MIASIHLHCKQVFIHLVSYISVYFVNICTSYCEVFMCSNVLTMTHLFTGLSNNTMSSATHFIFGITVIIIISLAILVYDTIYYYEYDKLSMWLKGKLLTQEDLHSMTLSLRHATSQHKFQGYVLPYKLYEQQTSATRNLWGLQYWANSVSMKVVEPFVSNNNLNFCPIIEGTGNPMRFRDLYDISYWNNQSAKHGCAELVAWEDFLAHASKSVILVFTYNVASSPGGLFNKVTNTDEIKGDRKCNGTMFPAQALQFFKNHGFQFVREVCIKFDSSTAISQYILGNYSPNIVTIIFALWHGIRKNQDHLNAPVMRTDNTVAFGMFPSIKMKKLSKQYVQKFNPGGGKYFGVMIRVERIYKAKAKRIGENDVLKYLTECATNLTQCLNIHPKWSRTLAIDLGQYGSKHYSYGKSKPEEVVYKTFFNSVFGNTSVTINEFEDSFKKYLNFDNAVVIAQLQRTIAVISDCLVLVGGGSFQGGALAMYQKLHPNEKDQCIIKLC